MSDIAVIADKDSGIGFKSIGFDTYFLDPNNLDDQEVDKTINRVFRKDYKIIFLTEVFYKHYMSLIEELTLNKLYPIAVAIPSVSGRQHLSHDIVKGLVEKALGGDFLDT